MPGSASTRSCVADAPANLTTMDDKRQEPPKQKTRKGLEIPVPKRKDVFGVFERAAKPLRRRPPKQ